MLQLKSEDSARPVTKVSAPLRKQSPRTIFSRVFAIISPPWPNYVPLYELPKLMPFGSFKDYK